MCQITRTVYHRCGHVQISGKQTCQARHVSECCPKKENVKKQSWLGKIFSSSSSSPSKKSCKSCEITTNVVDFCPNCKAANLRQEILDSTREDSYNKRPSDRYRETQRREREEREAFENAKRAASAAAKGYPGWSEHRGADHRSSMIHPELVSSFFSQPGTDVSNLGRTPSRSPPKTLVRRTSQSPRPQRHEYLNEAVDWDRWQAAQAEAWLMHPAPNLHASPKSSSRYAKSEAHNEMTARQDRPRRSRKESWKYDEMRDSHGETRLPPPQFPVPSLPTPAITRSNAVRRTSPQQDCSSNRRAPPVSLAPIETDLGYHQFSPDERGHSPVSPPAPGDSDFYRGASPVSPSGTEITDHDHGESANENGRRLNHFSSSIGRDIDAIENYWNQAAGDANYRQSTYPPF